MDRCRATKRRSLHFQVRIQNAKLYKYDVNTSIFRIYFSIEEKERPVKLTRHVLGFIPPANSYLFNNYLTNELVKILNEILGKLSAEKQILVCIMPH